MISRFDLQQRLLHSARNVFDIMADISLEECHEGPALQEEDWVTALVGFDGSYTGLVVLHCPGVLARRIAGGLLSTDDDLAVQDVHDAMGEVVNILGGDIKLLLDGGGKKVQLSVPSVFNGDTGFHDEFMMVPETVALAMTNGDERLMVGVQISRGE
jgi:chemotaxis protein CheX